MSDTARLGTPLPRRADQDIDPLRVSWGWIVALGVVYVAAGVIALGSVVMATVASVAVVGAMMLVSGIAEVVNAFRVKTWGKFFLWALLGALYVIAGLVTFRIPLLAATVLTLILGIDLIVSGFLRIFLAMQMMQGTSWGWVALSGVITVLVGGTVLAQWPVLSLFMLGIFSALI